ncbi:MAG: hypothetical protein ACLFUM_07005 [Spirochaetaceae bacterium]
MDLKHTQIPLEFIQHLPDGMKLVTKHGKQFLVVDELYGPNGENLISERVRIHGERAIELEVTIGDSEGMIFVDAYWGSHAKLYSFLVDTSARDSLVTARVPGDGPDLMVDRRCDEEGCGSDRAIELHLPGGKNKIYVCARLGCPGHQLEVPDLPSPVSETVSRINFFGAGSIDDNWFDEV